MFMSFLTLSSVVGIISEDIDITVIYNSMSEEEEVQNSFEEIKEEIKMKISAMVYPMLYLDLSPQHLFHDIPSKCEHTHIEIPLPPPELV